MVPSRPKAVGRITSFRSDVIRPKGTRHGAIFAIMVELNAQGCNRGTNTIAEVICHGEKLAQGCLVQFRGTKKGGIDNMSRHRTFKRDVAGIRL